ncbi:carboxy-S-adenosyl-L-methionine synthase CmoA [Oligoflexus tunisiensis]|uniref:carboxy-S-adenosyl-L-methionine synthase CmoA n=1 Tax=Oligoflexus tunisiensis TaxID=708132 RepID=UPI000A4DC9D1|nr:carboxy-S-adenosyl-L-methionine synthase CmoA [Oligoflexus tunisiensis]
METAPRPEIKLVSHDDHIFAGSNYPKPFSFNKEVAHVFDDMVRRSIPLYLDVVRATADWVQHFYRPQTAIIDIGCSTGTTTHHVAHTLQKPAQFLAVDLSASMIEKAREKLADLPARHQLTLLAQDIRETPLPRASVVIINYTLQFLPVADRLALLSRIYEALVPGGIVIISEKVRSATPQFQELTTMIYERFKEEQGYSRNEIERKKEALDQVLIPFTEQEHRQNLTLAGFQAIDSLMKWNNFLTLIAQKEPRP